jgi:RHS repeat-associated protein
LTCADLNRLETASGMFSAGQSQQNCSGANRYIYNAIGNLTGKCGAVLTYGDAMHPSAVTNNSATDKNYTYDANGNMLNRGIQAMIWNIDNRVASITMLGGGTALMEYDYTGTRVKKDAGASGLTLFPFQGYEIAPGGQITKFIRIGVETFAAKKGTNKYFYHNDHLGGVNVITNSTGARVQLNEYDPWGTVSRTEGTIDPTNRFTGQDLDPETGLYYYGGRYYDAEIARFISPDPFVQDIFDPQNLNRYSYVVNNPQNYIDPDGYFHKVKKKKGGFFKKFFSGLLIIAGIFTLQPELSGLGAATLAAEAVVSNIAVGLTSIFQGIRGLASEIGDTGPPGIGNVGGFSPALQFAMAPGCDVFCSDTGWDFWQILAGLFQVSEAEAACRIVSCPTQTDGGGAGRIPLGGRPPGGGGAGAMRRNEYVGIPKHGSVARGNISAAPANGQSALDVSVQVKPTSPTRVGVDYQTGEFVVFHENLPGQRVFSGHVRPWEGPGGLTQEMRNALIKSGLTDARGRIIY